MSNRPQGNYDASQINLSRLQQFAKRVAAESRVPKSAPIERQESRTVEAREVGLLDRLMGRASRPSIRLESIVVVGPHWVLHSTHHWIEEKSSRKTGEYNEQRYWVLDQHGNLCVVWRWEDYTLYAGQSFGQGKFERDTTVEEMSVQRILELDHDFPSYERRQGGLHYWGNRDPGRRVRHAPGVGLSLALKKLLD